jgi:hypothetical protein
MGGLLALLRSSLIANNSNKRPTSPLMKQKDAELQIVVVADERDGGLQ